LWRPRIPRPPTDASDSTARNSQRAGPRCRSRHFGLNTIGIAGTRSSKGRSLVQDSYMSVESSRPGLPGSRLLLCAWLALLCLPAWTDSTIRRPQSSSWISRYRWAAAQEGGLGVAGNGRTDSRRSGPGSPEAG